jgi:hypothetical protein
MLKIDKNVPYQPERPRNRYPFAQMECGDSIFVPAPTSYSARVAAYRYAKLHNVRFASQIDEKGVRIWRVE